MTTIRKVTLSVTAAYGLLALVGGTIGYVSAGSLASLIAGGVAGVVLLVSAALMVGRPVIGLFLAFVISLALVGRFAKAAYDQGEVSPVAGLMVGGGLLVMLLTAVALRWRNPRPMV